MKKLIYLFTLAFWYIEGLVCGRKFATVGNAQESLSVSVGECIATFTSTLDGDTIVFAGDTFYNDDDLLGEPTMDTDRADRHKSADGTRDVVMQSLNRAGERDVTFLLGSDLDKLKSWGQSRVQKMFDFDFYYKYNTQSAEGARIQRHKRCVFKSLPIEAIGRAKGYVTCRISFGDLAIVDPSTGGEI